MTRPHAPPGIDPRIVFPILSVLVCVRLLTAAYWPAEGGLDVAHHQIGRDFINTWAGPQLAFSGRLGLLFDFDAYQAAISELFGAPLPWHAWSYPLFCLFLFWPLAQLPYFVALAAWTFGLFAIFAAMTLSRVERSSRLLLLILLAFAPAALINMAGGQNGFLTACLLIGGILLLDRRPVVAGILFGLLDLQAPSRRGRALRSAGVGRLADHCGSNRHGDPADCSLGRTVRPGGVAFLLPGHRGSAGSRARAVQRFRPPDGDVRDGERRAHLRRVPAGRACGPDRGRASGHRASRMGDPADV